jgi:hypothetical protein
MHPGCRRDHRDLRGRWVADLQAHRQGLPDRERLHLPDDRPGVHRGRAHQVRRERRRQAGQSSAWASSPDLVAAYQAPPDERLAAMRGRQQAAALWVERRPGRDVADAADPFPAKARTGCCRGAGCQDAVPLERQEVRR